MGLLTIHLDKTYRGMKRAEIKYTDGLDTNYTALNFYVLKVSGCLLLLTCSLMNIISASRNVLLN